MMMQSCNYMTWVRTLACDRMLVSARPLPRGLIISDDELDVLDEPYIDT